MTLWIVCLWGLGGAGAIEVSELYAATRRVKNFPWRCPGEIPFGPFLFSVVLRLGLGAFAAIICAKAGPLGPAGAVAAGIAAPKLLEQLGAVPPKVTTAPSGESLPNSQPATALLSDVQGWHVDEDSYDRERRPG
jgi:hypothetical protein